MSTTRTLHPTSRAFVALTLAAVALVTGMALSRPVAELQAQAPRQDVWLQGLRAKHRQLFDSPKADGGIPLVHVLNYYDTYNKAFQTADKDIDAVLTFYGGTTFFALNDAMWAKYKLGAFLGEKDASGASATANPWRSSPVILGNALPQASVETLQKRGATFIVCNNALGIFAGMVAKQQGLSAEAVHADMKANIMPGVTLVPAMVIAIEQAQNVGLTYHRQ